MTTPTETPPPAPDDLPDALADLWREVQEDHEMSAAELRTFADALRLAARADEAAISVAEHGVTILDRYGSPKINPACELEVRCRTASARLLASLKLTLEDDDGPVTAQTKPGPRPRKSRSR